MSKLYSNYLNLKTGNPDLLYLFKSGVFYIALDKDALKLSELFGFKITNLNEQVIKCGFPTRSLDVYINQLKNLNIPFQIIDSTYNAIDNYSDYLNNTKLKEIVQTLLNVDTDNLTFREAFELVNTLKNQLKRIYTN